jgi:hypothetical protein
MSYLSYHPPPHNSTFVLLAAASGASGGWSVVNDHKFVLAATARRSRSAALLLAALKQLCTPTKSRRITCDPPMISYIETNNANTSLAGLSVIHLVNSCVLTCGYVVEDLLQPLIALGRGVEVLGTHRRRIPARVSLDFNRGLSNGIIRTRWPLAR